MQHSETRVVHKNASGLPHHTNVSDSVIIVLICLISFINDYFIFTFCFEFSLILVCFQSGFSCFVWTALQRQNECMYFHCLVRQVVIIFFPNNTKLYFILAFLIE